MTTTRQRVDLLSRTYPRLFPRAEVLRLLSDQLGAIDALDHGMPRHHVHVQARAPKMIYHVCAGNLAISAITSICHGLILGAHNEVKLPGDREDAATRRQILKFVRDLPAALRRRVDCHEKLDEEKLERADAVIAFGGDATMSSLKEKLRWNQKFSAHGHAVSLLWLGDPNHLTSREARACAIDILTYDQLGCLSPQAIYLPPPFDLESLGEKLSIALEKEWQKLPEKPARSMGVASRISEARDLALALGHRVWLPPKRHLGWTVIHDSDPTFTTSPLHGVIFLRESSEAHLIRHLEPVRGRISTVGYLGKASIQTPSCWRNAFLELGVSRFCPAGKMQFPPLTWHHDGHPSLSDLVTWVNFEAAS